MWLRDRSYEWWDGGAIRTGLQPMRLLRWIAFEGNTMKVENRKQKEQHKKFRKDRKKARGRRW